MTNYMLAWGPTVIWAVVLFLLSAIPDESGDLSFVLPGGVLHLAFYSVFGATLIWGRTKGRTQVPHLALIMLGVLYGASDEWHQSFVPGRTPEGIDLAADAAGILIGYLTLRWWLEKRRTARATTL